MKWIGIIFMAGALACRATPYYVATNGDEGNNGSTWTLAVKTISNGVAKATTAGDVVWVSNGVYTLTAGISISTAITLRGQDRTNTIIQGQYPAITNRGIYINSAGATVDEFTVMNCGWPSGLGGGVSVNNGTLQNCIITSNTANGGGGVYNNLGVVTNCVISSNICIVGGNGGGGVYLSAGQLLNCLVENNTGRNDGGGIQLAGAGLVSGCVVAGNQCLNSRYGGGIGISGSGIISDTIISNSYCASIGGGVYFSGCTPTFRNCTITANIGTSFGGGICGTSRSMLLTNCVISYNTVLGGGGGGIDAGGGYALNGMTALWCRIIGNVVSNGDSGAGIYAGTNIFLDHCIIQSNTFTNRAYTSGAGIRMRSRGNGFVRNCLIVDNVSSGTTSGNAGGVYIDPNVTCMFTSCTIAGNHARNSGGGILLSGNGGDTFTNCIIVSNTLLVSAADNNIYMATSARSNSFYYSCSERLTNTAQGNITNSPLFLNAASGNWRLARGSPGINAGANESWMADGVDLDSRARLRYNTADMGAYEHIYEAVLYRAW